MIVEINNTYYEIEDFNHFNYRIHHPHNIFTITTELSELSKSRISSIYMVFYKDKNWNYNLMNLSPCYDRINPTIIPIPKEQQIYLVTKVISSVLQLSI